MKATVEIKGGKELERKLSQLDAKVARKVSSKAMRAGAKVVLAAVKKKAPRRKGVLAASLKVRAGRRKKGMIRFLVQTKDGDYKGATFYGAFITFGRKTGKRERRSARGRAGDKRRVYSAPRRQIAPNPFMQAGFEASKYEANQTILTTLRQGILAVAKQP